MASANAPEPAAEKRSQSGNAIVLEGRRGGALVTVSLRYTAVQELRACVKPGETATGLVFGRAADDAIRLEHCAKTVQADPPIGIFRTQSAGWPVITDEDCRRIRKEIPATRSTALVLVVRTLAQRPWAASLFVVDAKHPSVSENPILEFPFDEYLLRNGWLTDLAPPPAPHSIAPAQPRSTRHGRRWVAAAAVALVLGGAGAAWLFHWLPQRAVATAELTDLPDLTPPDVLSPIALKVLRTADDFEISWNRSADPVRAAKAGTLTIRNGPVTRMVPISAAQLHDGHIQYRPMSGVDADFRLELIQPDGNVESDSVQVLGFDTAPSPAGPATEPEPARPRRNSAPVQTADRTDAGGVRRQPAESANDRSEAVPTRRVNPILSKPVLAEMQQAKKKVSVSVMVSIDASGAVASAKVIGSSGEPSPSGPHIRLASLNAARQWRFRPATAAGKPIPTTLTLVFTF